MSTAPRTLRIPPFAYNPSIANLAPPKKLGEAILRSTINMKGETLTQVQALIEPQSLEFMAAIGTAWVVSQAFGVGEVADLLIIGSGVVALGWSVFTLAEELLLFFEKALKATTDHDMDEAGDHFAKAVAIIAVTVIVSLLMKSAGKSLRNRVPRLAGPRHRAGGCSTDPQRLPILPCRRT